MKERRPLSLKRRRNKENVFENKKGKLFGATKLSPGQRKGVARINILPPAERDPIRRFDFYVFTNENRTADSWTSPVENLKCRTGRIN